MGERGKTMLKKSINDKGDDYVETIASVEAEYKTTIDFDIMKTAEGEKTLAILLYIGDSRKITILTRKEAFNLINDIALLLGK